ncbi:MAG TPA: alpha/beta fold hydrolase [Vicinamibacterales bacterium]|nr:alpha/beta fold hydrolase [Vicinamibacterales bacterium]
MSVRGLVAVAATCVLAGCGQAPSTQAIDRLTPCSGDDAPADAYCGTLTVYENRAAKQGRQITLNIVVLPALRADAQPDPLFFLAGGPGQGAAKLARMVREMFRTVQRDRDIVLVDQRGTGKSNPLNCDPDEEDDSLQAALETAAQTLARLKSCMAKYDADLTQYTTPIAMDDLDDVRAFLRYERINLYGGSYGTRAALVYMRQHGDRVRSVILDGVAPADMRLPLFFPRDSQRAFDRLVADCESDEGCRQAYPNLGARMQALMTRLETAPPTVRVTHPRTGQPSDLKIDARLLSGIVVFALYLPTASALVPAIITAAEANDFQSMLALGTLGDGGERNMSLGMHLSVICAEDAPRNTPEELARESAATLFGKYVMKVQSDACAFWPRGSIDASFYEPVKSDIPTLVLSGEIDPVTPPSWGEQAAAHLSNSKHIIIPGTGHTAGGTGCGQRLMREFIEKGSAQNLDTSCVARVKRPLFFLTPAGPDPKGRTTPPPGHKVGGK